MTRALHLLSAKKIQHLKDPGRHADGGGLYLRITKSGAKSWVFMTSKGGAGREEIGLGGHSSVSLAKAREIADQMREKVATGGNPRDVISVLTAKPAPVMPKFGQFAEGYISGVEGGWKNAVHRQQWRNTLRDHAGLLTEMPLDEIGTEDLLAVLKPIWPKIPETADRVRNRIEKILDAAKVLGFRSRDSINPAQWRGHLNLLLPRKNKLSRGHHKALPFNDAPNFLAQLRNRSAVAAKALEFNILTAARTGEVLGARWDEIDLSKKIWTVPAVRMKAGNEHVVPLSRAAMSLLEVVGPEERSRKGLIFIAKGASLSNMAMSMLLRRMKIENATVHGFRSTFRDWAGDCTEYPRDLVEMALAHTISEKAEAAYRRNTAIERRRALMEDWAVFLESSTGEEPLRLQSDTGFSHRLG